MTAQKVEAQPEDSIPLLRTHVWMADGYSLCRLRIYKDALEVAELPKGIPAPTPCGPCILAAETIEQSARMLGTPVESPKRAADELAAGDFTSVFSRESIERIRDAYTEDWVLHMRVTVPRRLPGKPVTEVKKPIGA